MNDAEFDDTFKKVTSSLTSGKTKYGKIPKEHWSFPEWIDVDKAAKVREEMREKQVIYGDSVSYRHMCRYESGFFFRHPLMLDYEWYWRVEPSIELFCVCLCVSVCELRSRWRTRHLVINYSSQAHTARV